MYIDGATDYVPGCQGLKSTATGLLWWYVATSFPLLVDR